jgi:SAM-dependent methyltransferase
MLAEAAIRTSSLKRAGHQVTLRRADAQDLPFDDTTFDAVLCASALYQLPDPGAACHEFYRVLRPGGAAGIAIFGTPDPRWDSKNELVARLAPPIPSAGARIDERKLRELLAAAGFVDINITLDALDVVYETADAWLRQAWNHGERRALEAMDDSAIRELQRELPTALESAREDDGMIHWRPQVLLARARKP